MAYMHIDNLYKQPEFLYLFKNVYAMEKIHGTSAHVSYKTDGRVGFFSGGGPHDVFEALFDADRLKTVFDSMVASNRSCRVFGEFYGGKMQGMRHIYGDEMRFVVFEVKIGDTWLTVPEAELVAYELGLEFVDYKLIPCTIEDLDEQRNRPSTQAIRNGMGDSCEREGIVIRPLEEMEDHHGNRVVVKHKNAKFSERTSKRDTQVTPEKAEIMKNARCIAYEWVTDMRIDHVVDKLRVDPIPDNLGKIIPAMLEDVKREAKGEISWTKEVGKAVGTRTALLIKERVRDFYGMVQLITPTPILDAEETKKFIAKVREEAKMPSGPTPTPKLEQALKLIRE